MRFTFHSSVVLKTIKLEKKTEQREEKQQQLEQQSNTTVCSTHNLPLLAEERMALQRLVELALGDVGKDLVLSFICRAVGDPGDGGGGGEMKKKTTSSVRSRWLLRWWTSVCRRQGASCTLGAWRRTSPLIRMMGRLRHSPPWNNQACLFKSYLTVWPITQALSLPHTLSFLVPSVSLSLSCICMRGSVYLMLRPHSRTCGEMWQPANCHHDWRLSYI